MTWLLAFGVFLGLCFYIWGIFESAVDITAGIPVATEYAFLIMSVVAIVSVFLRGVQ